MPKPLPLEEGTASSLKTTRARWASPKLGISGDKLPHLRSNDTERKGVPGRVARKRGDGPSSNGTLQRGQLRFETLIKTLRDWLVLRKLLTCIDTNFKSDNVRLRPQYYVIFRLRFARLQNPGPTLRRSHWSHLGRPYSKRQGKHPLLLQPN